MHEFSITSQIVQNVLQEAKKHGAEKVLEVHLVIGRLTFLGLEQVRFAYQALVKGTVMEKSLLYIEEKDGRVKCRGCGYEGNLKYQDDPRYHIPSPTLLCPKCEGVLEIVGGRDCLLKRVKLAVSQMEMR